MSGVEDDGLIAHHVTLTVGDLDASVAWYRDVLGIEPVMERQGPGWRRTLMRGATGLMIGLTEHGASPTGDRFDETRVGLDHLSFACADLGRLQRWSARLDARDVEHSGIAETPVAHVLVFRDPDNIQLEFFSMKG